jgi:Uma2 family endonuclease
MIADTRPSRVRREHLQYSNVMVAPAQRTTEAEYLRLAAQSDVKLEYVGGVVIAMAGASPRHNLVAMNLGGALRGLLAETRCLVLGSDQRVRVAPTGAYVYPDITLVCAEPQWTDDAPPSLMNPLVLVEVLSPTTEDHDRGVKLAHYRRMASVREIVLVDVNERRLELYRRLDNGQWLLTDVVSGELELTSIDRRLALAEIYAKVDALPLDPQVVSGT